MPSSVINTGATHSVVRPVTVVSLRACRRRAVAGQHGLIRELAEQGRQLPGLARLLSREEQYHGSKRADISARCRVGRNCLIVCRKRWVFSDRRHLYASSPSYCDDPRAKPGAPRRGCSLSYPEVGASHPGVTE